MSWRDTVRSRLERHGIADEIRRIRHFVRSRGGRSDRQLIADHLSSTDEPKLQLGCGTRCFDGWLNADLSPRSLESIRLDATKPLPFPEATFAYVYSEHMIEHVGREAAERLCSEWFRVLRPGGRLRVSTPDLTKLLHLFGPGEWSDDQRRYAELIAVRHIPSIEPAEVQATHVLNHNVREWGHQFLYDAPTFEAMLAAAGFVEICPHGLQESDDPVLCGLANDARMPPGLVDFETMTYEAVRP